MKSCIYPGTFDPVTNGHLDVIKRAIKIFDKVVVAVAASQSKKPLFSLQERVKMVKISTANLKNVEVVGFDNLLVDFAKSRGINVVIRASKTPSYQARSFARF